MSAAVLIVRHDGIGLDDKHLGVFLAVKAFLSIDSGLGFCCKLSRNQPTGLCFLMHTFDCMMHTCTYL